MKECVIHAQGSVVSDDPAAIQGASATEAVIPVATGGLSVSATYFPGTYIVQGAGVLVP